MKLHKRLYPLRCYKCKRHVPVYLVQDGDAHYEGQYCRTCAVEIAQELDEEEEREKQLPEPQPRTTFVYKFSLRERREILE